MWGHFESFNGTPEPWHGYWGHMGPGSMGLGWYGTGWLGIVFMVAWWGAVLVAVIALVKWIFFHNGNRMPAIPKGESALEILKKRYARGEIDKEQYLAMKHDLET